RAILSSVKRGLFDRQSPGAMRSRPVTAAVRKPRPSRLNGTKAMPNSWHAGITVASGLLLIAPSSPSSSGAEALGEPAGHQIEVAGCEVRDIPRPPGFRALPRLLRAAGLRGPQSVIRPGEDLDRDVTVPGHLQAMPYDRQILLGRQRGILFPVDRQHRASHL